MATAPALHVALTESNKSFLKILSLLTDKCHFTDEVQRHIDELKAIQAATSLILIDNFAFDGAASTANFAEPSL